MSYQYTNFENTIPIVEKYINKVYHSTIDFSTYEENNKKYNYFTLDQGDDNADNQISYILRVKKPIKNYQIFACGAGGSGGLIYGKGGNGGNYLYIDNLNVNPSITSRHLKVGSYLIITGKAANTITDLERYSKAYESIMDVLKAHATFYLIRYDDRHFRTYKNSIETIDRYKTRNWNREGNVDNTIGEMISIDTYNKNKNNRIDLYEKTIRTVELIFYLKKGAIFKFVEMTNPNYTRIIRISNNNNINILFTPTIDNNYIYTAGEFDEIISILCYPNSNTTITEANKLTFDSLFDVYYMFGEPNRYNYYIYNFNNRTHYNSLNEYIEKVSNNNTTKHTNIYYNSNPDATYSQLEDVMNKNYLGIQGGANGFTSQISTNRFLTISTILKRYYMPYLFSVDNTANLQGGAAGSTFVSSGANIIMNKLGVGDNNFIRLNRLPPRNVGFFTSTNEWLSGQKGTFSTSFKIYASYRKDQNIELNSNTLSNGGFSGYWQFIKDEINYSYGANGVNDLNSPNYGAYGCGGQGGSVLIDNNSKMTGGKGKDGVFILSFINFAVADIINNNTSLIKKMVSMFINDDYNTNNKLTYINNLRDNNTSSKTINKIDSIINNTFIHDASIHLTETYITKLDTYIDKLNLVKIIALSYIIQRIYYILSINKLDLIEISKITLLEILFIDDVSNERIDITNPTTIKIFIYDKYTDENKKILGHKYIKNFLEPLGLNNYHELLSLETPLIDNYLSSKKKIIIIKENGILYDMTNDIKTEISSYGGISTLDFNNYYKFLIIMTSYIYDIPKKDFKVMINVINTIFQVIRLNSVIYSIIYENYSQTDYTSKAIINRIYGNLRSFNYELKEITDRIKLTDNIFLQQNEFKLYFNKRVIEYDKLKDKNIQTGNFIKSKKAFMDGKESLKKTINTISIIMIIVLILCVLWLLVLLIGSVNDFDVIPQLFLILVILIIAIFIINYYEKYYSYKEDFETVEEVQMVKQMDIFNKSNDYSTIDYTYEEYKYKITFINSSSEFILYKNNNTSIILIQGGDKGIDDGKNRIDGTGGTINIYNQDYISNNLEENKKYKIDFSGNSITINDKFKTNIRGNLDNKDNIKVFINNDGTILNNNNYTIFKDYGDNLIASQSLIKDTLNMLFNYTKSSNYYGSKGNTINPNGDKINKFNNPSSYGVGGIYNSPDKSGNSGVMIIITKEIEIEGDIHSDLQTMINFYNNNINKLIYDNFNNIYLLDNTIIYKNAASSFRKRMDSEEEKEDQFKKYGEKIHDYSHIILMDVYYRFALVKLFISIFIAIVICFTIYYLKKDLWILLIVLVIFMILFLIVRFFYTTEINTRRDYYKYYWS